ncbi:MAG: App1 family protein [Myxococcota bacterium]|nr:DUF2183 domain-containing protein [Deltaproteobacteria bacterium]MDQ3336045.1 App1 family protein [Myxococcota bacterium]
MTPIRYCGGRCVLVFALGLAACATGEPEIEDLGDLGDGKSDTALPRIVAVDLDAGESKRFRIKTPAFVASLEQMDDIAAQLTAKHYDFSYTSGESAEPGLVVTGDGTSRNWTLTVFNRGSANLDAKIVVDVPHNSGELGIVSDIDKTVLPPETAAGLPPPYPGIAALLRALEGTVAGDVRFVTARTPDGVVGIPDWMAMHDVPQGTIDTGISGAPWVAQAEKVADISRIFDASADQPYVLFGDTSHRDPEVYKEIRTKYPTRIAEIFIHKVNATVTATRVAGMHLVNNYAEAAAIAFGKDLITEVQARAIMNAARAEGLAITAAEIDALIDAAR